MLAQQQGQHGAANEWDGGKSERRSGTEIKQKGLRLESHYSWMKAVDTLSPFPPIWVVGCVEHRSRIRVRERDGDERRWRRQECYRLTDKLLSQRMGERRDAGMKRWSNLFSQNPLLSLLLLLLLMLSFHSGSRWSVNLILHFLSDVSRNQNHKSDARREEIGGKGLSGDETEEGGTRRCFDRRREKERENIHTLASSRQRKEGDFSHLTLSLALFETTIHSFLFFIMHRGEKEWAPDRERKKAKTREEKLTHTQETHTVNLAASQWHRHAAGWEERPSNDGSGCHEGRDREKRAKGPKSSTQSERIDEQLDAIEQSGKETSVEEQE